MPPPSTLLIKTKSVTRLITEENSYHKELKAAQDSLAKLIGSSSDEYELKQQRRVVEETRVMIPEVRERLQKALCILRDQLGMTSDSEPEENRQKAQRAVEDAQELLEKDLPSR